MRWLHMPQKIPGALPVSNEAMATILFIHTISYAVKLGIEDRQPGSFDVPEAAKNAFL
jgi:hypothetical protein